MNEDAFPDRPIRVVFFGTPDFAVPALRALATDPRFEIALVVTQPDRPAGRGKRLLPPAVKTASIDLGLPVYQPESLRRPEQREPLVNAVADVFVVAAFGMIFGPKTLAIPTYGCINLHASILPAYRGAAPISAAIASGDRETGVSVMRMEAGLDTGPVLEIVTTAIRSDETTESLTGRLAELGAGIVGDVVGRWVRGEIEAHPQGPGATLTRPLTKADGWLDWSRPAVELEAHVRAMWPWPRAWTTTAAGETTVQVHAASVVAPADVSPAGEPGTVIARGRDLVVLASLGALRLDTVLVAGGKPVSGSVLLDQSRARAGDVLGRLGAPVGTPLFVPVPD